MPDDADSIAAILKGDSNFVSGSVQEKADMIALLATAEETRGEVLRKLVLLKAVSLSEALKLQRGEKRNNHHTMLDSTSPPPPPPPRSSPPQRHQTADRVPGNPWELLSDDWRYWPPLPSVSQELPPAVIFGALLNPAWGFSDQGNWRSAHNTVQMMRADRIHFSNETIRKHCDTFLQAAHTRKLIDQRRLVVRVLTDAEDMPPLLKYRGIFVHRVEPVRLATGPPMPGQDARWEAIQQVIRDNPPEAEACTFAVDMYDTRLIGDLPALCFHNDPNTLFAASDLCPHSQPAKAMMEKQMNNTGFAPSFALREFIDDRERPRPPECDNIFTGGDCAPPYHRATPSIAHNVGIWGGRKEVFTRVLNDMVSRIRRHYEVSNARRHEVVDMLVFNEIALEHKPIERGWPYGRVNMPMWGEMCNAHTYYCKATAAERDASTTCAHKDMLVGMQAASAFFFTHKLGCGQRLTC